MRIAMRILTECVQTLNTVEAVSDQLCRRLFHVLVDELGEDAARAELEARRAHRKEPPP